MNSGQNIFVILAVAVMFSLFGFIVYGDKGLAELNTLRETRDTLNRKNQSMIQQNLSLYRTIERLRNDLDFIESIARHELGLVGREEIIFKLAETAAGEIRQPGQEETRQSEPEEMQQTEQGETERQ
ncbi:MAG: septum formation initiator family protein [Desulfobacterales bacterium]